MPAPEPEPPPGAGGGGAGGAGGAAVQMPTPLPGTGAHTWPGQFTLLRQIAWHTPSTHSDGRRVTPQSAWVLQNVRLHVPAVPNSHLSHTWMSPHSALLAQNCALAPVLVRAENRVAVQTMM